MADWFASLSTELQIFYVIGITALLFTVVQTTMTLIGLGVDAIGVDLDFTHNGHSSGIGLFSSQTIAAFFLGLGWGGVFGLQIGLHILLAVFIAFNFGGLLMVLMYFMLIGLVKLQSSGNLDYSTAVGETAEVYVTIPSQREGHGQIQVMINGRLSTVDAETESEVPLNPGQNVRVTELIGKTDFLVERI